MRDKRSIHGRTIDTDGGGGGGDGGDDDGDASTNVQVIECVSSLFSYSDKHF